MKILSVLMLVFASNFWVATTNDVNVTNDEAIVTATIEYADGTVVEASYELTELINAELNDTDVIACTYVLTNGDCSTTASTCAGARAGMMACARALSYI
jgi:hypothetical protein